MQNGHTIESWFMARWLVTAAAGMLGRDLIGVLRDQGEEVTGLTRADLDITDTAAVREAVAADKPTVVVNCAGWTAVDDAETHEAQALAVNGHGAANLAAACRDAGVRLMHVSTDYVFDGDASKPWAEDDLPAPRSAYGRTKLAGEQAVLSQLPGAGYVVRTAWLYGEHGPNFVRTMIRLAASQPTVNVVADQYGQPTWTRDVACQLAALEHAGAHPGIYHATSSGETSWFGLAQEVFRLIGADPDRVRPTTSSQYRRPAPRPAYSVLGHGAWAAVGIPPIQDWRTALHQAISSLIPS
jgi:dTDP-4-dehydrorhamnose reductase